MATFPCPGCQAQVSTDARFCGRCGTVISSGASDEETRRAPRIDVGVGGGGGSGVGARTMMDPVPYGEAEGTKQDLKATMSDPNAIARAQEMRDVAIAAATAATAPKAAPLNRTLLIGGPPIDLPSATAPTLQQPSTPMMALPLQPEPSPLSQSVPAPQNLFAQAMGSQPPTGAAKTMLGIPASQLVAPAPAPAPAPVPAPQHLAPALKTMMGVAIPGIAPMQSSAPPQQQPPAQGAPMQFESRQGTMLGVAVPGIAPIRNNAPGVPARAMTAVMAAAPPPPVLPAPPPLALEPLPEPPRIVKKSGGVPLGAVLGVLAVLLIGAGAVGAYFVFFRATTPITAHPQLDESGKEFLALQCPSCPDGTTVGLGASTATIKAGAATLALPAPLAIGDNDIKLKIDRPGAGRDEEVRIPLHVSYRVRADLSTLSAKPSAITVRVEAQPGSTVQVDGQPLTLDPQGKGAYVIDLSKESEGPSDEQKPFERKIPVAVTNAGKTESDQLTARTSIVPLHVDAPGTLLFTEKASAAISGQTRVNGTVTVDGQAAPVDDKGHFAVKLPLADGEKKIEIIAGAAPLAPRTVHATVVHVASLEAKAKELAGESPLAYDAFAEGTAKKVGQKAFVEGEIVEARSGQGYSSLLVDDKKACAKGAQAQCLVRVLFGEETTLAHGDTVRVYGKIAGVAAGKQPIPDLDASLVLTVKAGRH